MTLRMKTMWNSYGKYIKIFLICTGLLLFLAGGNAKYNEDDFIGKTSTQIEAELGRFDCCGMTVSVDGLYRNTACGYTIKEPKVGFLDTSPEILFFITFDENGIADGCYEGYRSGS